MPRLGTTQQTPLTTSRPEASVSSRDTYARVSSSTLGRSSSDSTQITWESAFALTRQGKPSNFPQRMQRLRRVGLPSSSSSRIPSGRWKG